MTELNQRDDPRELYRRMRLIPSWDYDKVATLDISVVGLGGLGAASLQLLLMLGMGERGLLTLIDEDHVEPSNRSRIPYAAPSDDGALKVSVAARYARLVRPRRAVRELPLSLFSDEAQQAIAASDILIGAVDSELARVAMNHLAYAFCLPYLDGGAGIIVGETEGKRWVQSGGQVRIIVPDLTPCLLCNLGIERETLDREFMQRHLTVDPDERTVLERSGYIRGLGKVTEQPSAAHLNFLVASALITLLVQYLTDGLPNYHALHFDLEAMEWLKSTARQRPQCSVCVDGELGHGRFFALPQMAVSLLLSPREPAIG